MFIFQFTNPRPEMRQHFPNGLVFDLKSRVFFFPLGCFFFFFLNIQMGKNLNAFSRDEFISQASGPPESNHSKC